MATVAFYISGHGFGHASRQIEIVNALARRRPDLRVLLRTTVPRWLLERTIEPRFALFPAPCDTGIVQVDSLRLDAQATADAARTFYASFEARIAEERALLRDEHVDFVVVDAPPLGCAGAAAARIPSVVVSNFTWDWIYGEYEEFASAPEVIPLIRQAYASAAGAWRLPIHGGFASIQTIVDAPFVARHARHAAPVTRTTLGLPLDRRVALISFGGYGVSALELGNLDCLDRWDVVTTGATLPCAQPAGVHMLADDATYARGLRYEDLVAASDVVITKPGYGIVSECVANGAAMIYTSRGRFAEYPVMVAQMPRVLRCIEIAHDQLFGGRWLDALETVITMPPPGPRPATNGAEVIADMICAALAPA